MEKVIRNSIVAGHIIAAPSKSQTIRALAAASLCSGQSLISDYSRCDDALAAIEIINALGSKVKFVNNDLIIIGSHQSENKILNCRESAFCLRLFSSIATLNNIGIELIAENSLMKRHTGNIEEVFQALGVRCNTNKGYPPIKVQGLLKGGNVKIDCSKTSQLLSGLLYSLPLVQDDSIIDVSNLKSKPYIDLTLNILSKFGIDIHNDNYEIFGIKCGQSYNPTHIKIEGDWSCASNFLVAAAINGEVSISNLNLDSFQGDKAIIDLLSGIGADITKSENMLKVKSNELKAFEFDAGNCPDLVPILTVLGCFCDGESVISDISRLAGKESSRAEIIAKELNSIGGKVKLGDDYLTIHNTALHGGKVDSHGDHRIAMALAIAGLSASESVTIENTECMSKSYPDFWKDFEILINYNHNSAFRIQN